MLHPRTPLRRRFAVAALALTTLAVGACSPTTTNRPYSPSDGVRVLLNNDQVSVNNLFVVANGPCQAGVLVGSVTSPQSGEVVVEVLSRADAAHITAPEQECINQTPPTVRVALTAPGTQIFTSTEPGGPVTHITPVQVTPGGVMQARVSFSDGEAVTVTLPVLDGTLPDYEALANLAQN